jgi:hypothetical protein
MRIPLNSKLGACWSTLALVGLCLTVGGGCGGEKGKVDVNRYTALGEVMAGKTTELCGGNGGLVLLVGDRDNNQSTGYGLAKEAFRKALGKDMQVVATEVVKMPPMLMPGDEPVPAAKFTELLQKYSSADCLVSFVGVPVLTPKQIAELPSPRPRVVEVVVLNSPTKAMLAGKVVNLAALFRVGSQPPASGSSQEFFDAQYQLVTSETTGLLPR